jgi:hypothetical protein
MAVIKLFKNEDLVFSKEGNLKDNLFIFENITYDKVNNILIREDADFKYVLDFKKSVATITLKVQNYYLDIKLKTLLMELDDNYHKIVYNIESDEELSNVLEVIF